MKRTILAAIVVAVFLLLMSGSALGCICALPEEPLTAAQARTALIYDFDRASAVFSGEVIELDTVNVKFKVEKLWQGDFGDEITMSIGTKDPETGYMIRGSCDYRFKPGEKYLVFAYKTFDGALHTNICTRTDLLRKVEPEMKILDEIHPPRLKNQKISIPANLFGFVLSGETLPNWIASCGSVRLHG
jgi:hypothetical protein